MKYRLMLSACFALLGVANSAWAAGENEMAQTYDQQWQGMGVGGLMGALLGGPPGFIIGIAGGALIGHQQGQADDLAGARREVLELTAEQRDLRHDLQVAQNEVTTLRQNNADKSQQEQVLIEERYADQLAAIANGVVLNIQFRTESAELAPHFEQQLTRVIALLDAFPDLLVHIDGYADQRGTEQFNHALSQRRVDAVAQHLQTAGVAVNRIRKVPYGESQTEYAENDVEGMSFDRRVVLYFCRRSS